MSKLAVAGQLPIVGAVPRFRLALAGVMRVGRKRRKPWCCSSDSHRSRSLTIGAAGPYLVTPQSRYSAESSTLYLAADDTAPASLVPFLFRLRFTPSSDQGIQRAPSFWIWSTTSRTSALGTPFL